MKLVSESKLGRRTESLSKRRQGEVVVQTVRLSSKIIHVSRFIICKEQAKNNFVSFLSVNHNSWGFADKKNKRKFKHTKSLLQ